MITFHLFLAYFYLKYESVSPVCVHVISLYCVLCNTAHASTQMQIQFFDKDMKYERNMSCRAMTRASFAETKAHDYVFNVRVENCKTHLDANRQ